MALQWGLAPATWHRAAGARYLGLGSSRHQRDLPDLPDLPVADATIGVVVDRGVLSFSGRLAPRRVTGNS